MSRAALTDGRELDGDPHPISSQAAALRGSDDALAARAERFKGTSAAEDAAAEAAAAAAARPFAPIVGTGRSKLRVVNKSDTMRRFYVRLLKSGAVRQKATVLLLSVCLSVCLSMISRPHCSGEVEAGSPLSCQHV